MNTSETNEKDVNFKQIGVIHSCHKIAEETPIQPIYAAGIEARVEVFPEYKEGLRDLDGFSHIYLLYKFHMAKAPKLIVKPFLEDIERGIFSTRAPVRPNPLGMSIVKLIKCSDNILYIEDCDILDGTPLLDIKPYSMRFDIMKDVKNGWQDGVTEENAQTKGLRGYQK